MTRKYALLVGVVGALSSFTGLAACTSSKTAVTTTTTTTTAAATTTLATTTTTPAAKGPTKIVSLSPTATEILFAIGAGPQVIAVDDQSNYPATAPITDLSGYTPNVEAIAKYAPDLVITQDDTAIKDGLAALKITLLSQPPALTIDDSYKQITELGQVTGHADEAKKLVDSMTADLAALYASAPKSAVGASFYYELDNTYYSVSDKSFLGDLLAKLGLKNIANEADKQGTGYPQLSSEAVVAANPKFIFLADSKCCKQTAETVAARPGWATIDAVTNKKIIILDDDIASRWGPRVVTLLKQVADATK